MIKHCPVCVTTKPITDFYSNKSNKSGRQNICKECQKAASKKSLLDPERRKIAFDRNRARCDDLRNQVDIIKVKHGCCLCPENSKFCLDLHHTEKDDKVASVAYLISTKSIKLINAELRKCVVLCANCHRKVHFGGLQIPEPVRYVDSEVV